MPFRKISKLDKKVCNHPEHTPPKHICLPPGLYEYGCPKCGQITIVRQDVVTHHAEEPKVWHGGESYPQRWEGQS